PQGPPNAVSQQPQLWSGGAVNKDAPPPQQSHHRGQAVKARTTRLFEFIHTAVFEEQVRAKSQIGKRSCRKHDTPDEVGAGKLAQTRRTATVRNRLCQG